MLIVEEELAEQDDLLGWIEGALLHVRERHVLNAIDFRLHGSDLLLSLYGQCGLGDEPILGFRACRSRAPANRNYPGGTPCQL